MTLSLLLLLTLSAAPKTPQSVPVPKAKLLFAGDVTLGFHHEEYFDEQVKKGKSRDEMFAHGFSKVKVLADKADLFVVNLECPFTERGEKVPKNFNFRARPEFVATLAAGSVDVVSLANNHLMDYGALGLSDTLDTLQTAKIPAFGAGSTLAEARKPQIVTSKGIRFAFIGYFFLGDRNIEPPEVIARDEQPGVAGHHSDLEQLKQWVTEDVRAAKQQADVVIPFFHWGREGRSQPEPYQVELAHTAVEAGAGAVIGSHPHVLQGMELYQGVPILYSLGNFVFGGNWDPKDKKTAMVQLEFDAKGYRSAQVFPAFSDRFPEVPIQPYLAEGEAATQVMDHLRAISKPLGIMLPALSARPKSP